MRTLKKPIAALVLFASGAPAFAGEACDEQALNALRPLVKVNRPDCASVRMLATPCTVLPDDPRNTAAAIIFRGDPGKVDDDNENHNGQQDDIKPYVQAKDQWFRR